jgi:hypothetical protein
MSERAELLAYTQRKGRMRLGVAWPNGSSAAHRGYLG